MCRGKAVWTRGSEHKLAGGPPCRTRRVIDLPQVRIPGLGEGPSDLKSGAGWHSELSPGHCSASLKSCRLGMLSIRSFSDGQSIAETRSWEGLEFADTDSAAACWSVLPLGGAVPHCCSLACLVSGAGDCTGDVPPGDLARAGLCLAVTSKSVVTKP